MHSSMGGACGSQNHQVFEQSPAESPSTKIIPEEPAVPVRTQKDRIPLTVIVRDIASQEEKKVTVRRWDKVRDSVARGLGVFGVTRVLYGGIEVLNEHCWNELEIENDAVIMAVGASTRRSSFD